MNERPNTESYLELFINDIPMLDVRAPIEFEKGAFPGVVNLPLMNDEERHLVGIRYKHAGQESAIQLGNELVSGPTKEQRIQQWCEFVQANPNGYLYCFRGGLRSRTTQQWLKDAGIHYPLITGGYKAMRRFLIDELERICQQQVQKQDFVVVSGRTGTGKTRFLKTLASYIDLEGLANHRGSSFGRMLSPQPSQIDFDNSISIALLKVIHQKTGPIYLEDESRLIGRCALPLPLRDRMAACPLVVLESSLEERIGVVLEDYVIDMTADFIERDGEELGFEHFSEYLFASVERIERRLGSERKNILLAQMKEALVYQTQQGSYEGHRVWIKCLLSEYYDPMYDYQLEKKAERIILRGDKNTLMKELIK
jgi:tRNA 2-selenouridine synthase